MSHLLTLTLLTALFVGGVKGPTGFRRLCSGVNCPSTIRFTCVSTGRGRTVLNIGDNTLLSFLHSVYEGGANTNESRLNGDVRAMNLSRSAGMECSNMTDYCYTMFVEVRLTEQTLCKVFSCTTIFLDGSTTIETTFGNATASRLSTHKYPVPSAPMNLRILSQSESLVTFGWDSGSPTCNMNYSVSIINCGICNQDSYISRTNVTCDQLVPGQQMQCSVTVRSVSECGIFSAPRTRLFELLTPESETEATLNGTGTAGGNVGAIVGGVVGGIIIAVIVGIVVILTVWIKKRNKPRENTNSSIEIGDQQASHPRYSALHNSVEIPASNGNQEAVHSPQPSAQLQAGLDGAGIDVPGRQPPSRPQDHQSNPEAPTDQPTTSGAEAAATGTGEPQPLKQSQSETPTSLDQLNIKPEAADIDGDPYPSSVKPKGSVSDAGTDKTDSQQTVHVPQEHQSDPETPTDQSTSSGEEITGERQPLERNQSEKSKPEAFESSDSDPQSSVKPKHKKTKKRKKAVHKMNKHSYLPLSSADREGPVTSPTIKDFSEQMETGGESIPKSSLPSEYNHDVSKEVYASSNGGVDTRDESMAASLGGTTLIVAGNRQFSGGMEVSGLKALVKQVEEQRKEFNTKFTEQEKDFNKKLTDFKTDLKKEQKKEMDEKIQKLTNDIAILTAKVEQLTEMLGNKETDNQALKKQNKALRQKNKQLELE